MLFLATECRLSNAFRRALSRPRDSRDVRLPGDAAPVTQERVVEVRSRTVLRVLALVIGVAVLLAVIWIARRVVTWVFIALFLSLALDPLVNLIQWRGRFKRAPAITIAFALVLVVIV